MGQPIIHDGVTITYDWRNDVFDRRGRGLICPDTNARIIHIDPINTHIRYIDRVIRYNNIYMRRGNMEQVYRQQIARNGLIIQVNQPRDMWDDFERRERERILEAEEEKKYLEYVRECEFKTYDVDETEECPICYNHYGEQEDGTFLCKDGTTNSSRFKGNCTHHCCVECIKEIALADRDYFQGKCPLCRESWAGWLQLNYNLPAIISCFDNAILSL